MIICKHTPATAEFAGAGERMEDLCEAVCATVFLECVAIEGASKTPSVHRGPLEAALLKGMKPKFVLIKSFAHDDIVRMIDVLGGSRMLQHETASIACGAAYVWTRWHYIHARTIQYSEGAGFFVQIWDLHQRVCPSGPEFYTMMTCAAADATCARLTALTKRMARSLPTSKLMSMSWWPAVMLESIKLVKLNESAQLSAKDTMSVMLIYDAIVMLEAEARDEGQHQMLLEAGVLSAMEYAIAHDFAFIGGALSPGAAGVAVALVGRNEGGKTLSRETVFAVLKDLKVSLGWGKDAHTRSAKPAGTHVPVVTRVATMAISDANKVHMLECDGVLETLVGGLLVDSPRRDDTGADTLQEACVGVLLQLSLHAPWAEAMRAHKKSMEGLRAVAADHQFATDGGRQGAEQALFQLEGKRQEAVAALPQLGAASKHVMVSYCWAQQPVIKRIHAALVERGYAVWIDVEQMKGSTVDAMALAVEGACVMLMGVSREYKESTNCRLEAQYAMQREVSAVPLMLTEGYQADGWLGFMIGTRFWYGFYGAVVSEEEQFEAKVSELCRELGDRGRCVGVATAAVALTAAVFFETPSACSASLGLLGTPMKELRARAKAVGASAEQLETIADDDDPKQALVALLHQLEAEARTAELSSLPMKELRARVKAAGAAAEQLEEVADDDDPRRALLTLLGELTS